MKNPTLNVGFFLVTSTGPVQDFRTDWGLAQRSWMLGEGVSLLPQVSEFSKILDALPRLHLAGKIDYLLLFS